MIHQNYFKFTETELEVEPCPAKHFQINNETKEFYDDLSADFPAFICVKDWEKIYLKNTQIIASDFTTF